MAKAILFVRVSTEKQTLDAQSKELREFAMSDGYAPEDLIEIAEKESARKRGKIDWKSHAHLTPEAIVALTP